MSTILKISEAATIAIHTMALLSLNVDKLHSTKEIASALNVSENHLSKVLQRLAKSNLVDSTRGPKGGFKIKNKPNSISLLEIYEAIDGTLDPTDCLMGTKVCSGNCLLSNLLLNINQQVKEYFQNTKLIEFDK